MSDKITNLYWEKLRKAWKESFVLDVIQKFNDLSYVLKISDELGYDQELVLRKINGLPGDDKELAWKIYDSIWEDAFRMIKDVSEDLSFEVTDPPLIGTLPTGKINALAIVVPHTNKYILAFEVGLLQLITSICDFVALSLQPTASNGFEFKGGIDDGKAKEITNLLINYYTQGIPMTGKTQFIQNENQRTLSVGFRTIIKLFIVGHEYGHVGLKHLEQGDRQLIALLDDTDCTLSFPNDFQHEHEADHVGALIALVYHLKKGLPYWFSTGVIIYFLEFSKIIHQGIFTLFGVKIKDETHPPIHARIAFIESVVFSLISETDIHHYFAIKNFFNLQINAFEKVLEEELKKLKPSSLELAPMWRNYIFEPPKK